MLSAEEMAAVDDFRFKNRMPNRAAAVRELMRRGLGARGFGVAASGDRSTSSGVSETKSARSRKGKGARDQGAARAEDNDSDES
jgi:hypothetical protein